MVAGGDTYVHLLDARGRLVSRHQIRGPVWNRSFGDRPWQCYTALVRDLDRDGTTEIVVGTQNYELRVYDANRPAGSSLRPSSTSPSESP